MDELQMRFSKAQEKAEGNCIGNPAAFAPALEGKRCYTQFRSNSSEHFRPVATPKMAFVLSRECSLVAYALRGNHHEAVFV